MNPGLSSSLRLCYHAQHPGEVLNTDYLLPEKIRPSHLAVALKISNKTMLEIIKGKRSISTAVAIRLSMRFSTTAQYWLDLQSNWDLKQEYCAMNLMAYNGKY